MATVFLYHVVGDLTVGKPEQVEFLESEPVESAIQALEDCTECGIPVWKKKQKGIESSESRQQRFVGIINSLDIIAHLAKETSLIDQEAAMQAPVSEVVVPNNSLLKEVDPGTRLIDALEMMKQGVRRLLVPKSRGWKGMSKRFSIIYNGKWLKNLENPSTSTAPTNRSLCFSNRDNTKFCCLSRENVIRFLIGCLGALAPLPLSSISSLGAVTPHFLSIEASAPAIHASKNLTQDPSAVAVVEQTFSGQLKIIGDISASKLWKCDYLAAAWALANLSAGQFVTGVEDNIAPVVLPDFSVVSLEEENCVDGFKPKTFCSRNIGFFSSQAGPRSMYRGRSAPLTCKTSSSLAAVMAQMLSHRATHVWVTQDQSDDVLVGIITYTDILYAVTKPPNPITTATSST